MTPNEAVAALQACGSETCARTYRRHGVTGPLFGVRYGDLDKLARTAGTDQALARALFATGNHDARILACKVADPATIGARELDQWLAAADNHVLLAAVSTLAAASPHAERKADLWRKRKTDWAQAAGWDIVGSLAGPGTGAADARFAAELDRIRYGIARAGNRTRYAMNNALIAIGGYRAALRTQALAVARAIGRVEVDHGETGCKTPDAAAYIGKMADREPAKPPRRTKAT